MLIEIFRFEIVRRLRALSTHLYFMIFGALPDASVMTYFGLPVVSAIAGRFSAPISKRDYLGGRSSLPPLPWA